MKNIYLLAILLLPLWSEAQDISGCGVENPIAEFDWLQEAQDAIEISTAFGPPCYGGNISEYVYNGDPVIAVTFDCLDAPMTIYTCEGEQICLVGGETLPEDQCVDFSTAEFVTEWWNYNDCTCDDVYLPVCVEGDITFGNACEAQCAGYNTWENGECEPNNSNCDADDPLTELDWLAELTTDPNCCSTNQIEQLTAPDGTTYFYQIPSFGSAVCPTDIPSFIYDCEGNEVCIFSMIGTTPECIDLLNSSEAEPIWNCSDGPIGGGDDCYEENPIEELEWLGQLQEDLVSIIEDSGGFCQSASISEYNYNGETVFLAGPVCLDSGINVYDCEGNFLCFVGGLFPPEEQCPFWDEAEFVANWWEYEACICPPVFDPVCVNGELTYGNPCEAECDGWTEWESGECNDLCDGFEIVTAEIICAGECGCDNLFSIEAVGGDGNYTFTLPDGQIVTDGFDAMEITNWQETLTVLATDGNGCSTESAPFDVSLLCCDVAPCAEVYNITADCSEVNCVLALELADTNSCGIEILDQDGNAYTDGQDLADGDYTFTVYTEGEAGNDCASIGSFELSVENPIIDAIENWSASGALVYPNPTNGPFTIEGQWQVEIYGIDGSLLLTAKNATDFDLTGFERGIYLVKLSDERMSLVQKLLVQ